MDSSKLGQVIRTSPVEIMPGRYAVASIDPRGDSPPSAFLVCRDQDETTVIMREDLLPSTPSLATEKWFHLLGIRICVPFEAPGFLATITSAIADLGLNVLVVSTFSKDYLLLREADLATGCDVLRQLGFPIVPPREDSGDPPVPATECAIQPSRLESK